MKTCACGGDLLRHAVMRSSLDGEITGIRYICRDCRETFIHHSDGCGVTGQISTLRGRPIKADWRMAA